MGWWLAFLWYVALLVLICRWWYLWGIAKGRLLERIEQQTAWRPERQLHVVRDDGPGAA